MKSHQREKLVLDLLETVRSGTEFVKVTILIELPTGSYSSEMNDALDDLQYEVRDILEELNVTPIRISQRIVSPRKMDETQIRRSLYHQEEEERKAKKAKIDDPCPTGYEKYTSAKFAERRTPKEARKGKLVKKCAVCHFWHLVDQETK